MSNQILFSEKNSQRLATSTRQRKYGYPLTMIKTVIPDSQV